MQLYFFRVRAAAAIISDNNHFTKLPENHASICTFPNRLVLHNRVSTMLTKPTRIIHQTFPMSTIRLNHRIYLVLLVHVLYQVIYNKQYTSMNALIRILRRRIKKMNKLINNNNNK